MISIRVKPERLDTKRQRMRTSNLPSWCGELSYHGSKTVIGETHLAH